MTANIRFLLVIIIAIAIAIVIVIVIVVSAAVFADATRVRRVRSPRLLARRTQREAHLLDGLLGLLLRQRHASLAPIVLCAVFIMIIMIMTIGG